MKHLKEHYENVQVFIKDNWMRLDFQKYSHLSTEDLKKSIADLYEFMKNYEYFQKVMEIKSNIYKEAIHYMKKDLQTDNDNRESTID
jgi:glycerol-3-phosphate O-acyltransferase